MTKDAFQWLVDDVIRLAPRVDRAWRESAEQCATFDAEFARLTTNIADAFEARAAYAKRRLEGK